MMIRALVCLAVLLMPAWVSAQGIQWVSGNRWMVPALSPSETGVIYIMGHGGVQWPNLPAPFPLDQWTTIDLANDAIWHTPLNIPVTAKAVTWSGILIVTNATNATPNPANCTIGVGFRAMGSQLGYQYQMQAASTPADGDRENSRTTVALVDRKFQMFWTVRDGAGQPSEHCRTLPSGIGMNLTLAMVLLDEPITVPPPPPPPPIPSVAFRLVCGGTPIVCQEGA